MNSDVRVAVHVVGILNSLFSRLRRHLNGFFEGSFFLRNVSSENLFGLVRTLRFGIDDSNFTICLMSEASFLIPLLLFGCFIS